MNIAMLTGAGISAESGLGTFRDKGGLWDKFDPMQLATPEAFASSPERVMAFYNARRKNLVSAKPNAAHLALAAMERRWQGKGEFLLVTQNIDNLHERAGSEQWKRFMPPWGQTDVFVAIGTSGTVWPAAGFVQEASAAGAHTIELNLEPRDVSALFAEGIYGLASAIVPQWAASVCTS